jgi:hypothetical protein
MEIDIRKLLNSGITEKEVLDTVQKEINKEKAKIEEEKRKAAEIAAKNEELDGAREDLIYAVIDYLTVLGVFPKGICTNEDIEAFKDALKESENELGKLSPMMELIYDLDTTKAPKNKGTKTSDDVLMQFLKTLS